MECQSAIAGIKRDKTLSKGEKESEIAACEKELAKAKAVEAKHKDEISKLIAKAESYLKENFDSKYYNAVKASCEAEKAEGFEKLEPVRFCLLFAATAAIILSRRWYLYFVVGCSTSTGSRTFCPDVSATDKSGV